MPCCSLYQVQILMDFKSVFLRFFAFSALLVVSFDEVNCLSFENSTCTGNSSCPFTNAEGQPNTVNLICSDLKCVCKTAPDIRYSFMNNKYHDYGSIYTLMEVDGKCPITGGSKPPCGANGGSPDHRADL